VKNSLTVNDLQQHKTMIFEDYISRESINSFSWSGPLTKKHNKAILGTFVAAVILSLATNKNFYEDSVPVESEEDVLIAYNSENLDVEDIPLAQAFASVNPKEQLENYDDEIAEIDLAGEDDKLNSEVSALAARDSKDSSVDSLGAKWITENVQKGDSISSIFQDLSIPASTLASILENKEMKRHINRLKIGDKLSFLIDSNGDLLVFIKPISDKEQVRFNKVNTAGSFNYVKETLDSFVMDDTATEKARKLAMTEVVKPAANAEDKTLTASNANPQPAEQAKPVAKQEPSRITPQTRGRLVVVTVAKGETFSTAANKAGITYSEINRILQIFKGRISFARNIHAGDTMRVLFTEAKGKGKICAVEFNLSKGGKVTSYLNTADGKYYDEKGLNAQKATFARFPFKSRVRVTSQFNPGRRHPVTGVVRPHNGVDFGLPVGTPIVAPSMGVVEKATFTRSTGYYIVVRHSNGLSTVYMHLSKLLVSPGQRVNAGSVIARSGNTGLSTGPHLHYEVRLNGRAVNPLRVNLDSRSVEINSKERKAFANNVERYKRELHQNSLMAKR
jgi:murein DD-endopeptidase MepM/ murein hydrolase activator NlpD